MFGPYTHNIDPIIGRVFGFWLWWYGLSYSLGFLGVFFFLRRAQERMALSLNEVYSLTLYIALGVLCGGRLVEVFFYEWSYYRTHPLHIGAAWLGGMSTHGILLGATLAVVLFCRRHEKSFLVIADELAVAGAYIMGVGRLGNFIDGQIVGSLTDVPWGVKFPDADGFRHPVVLYDGIKNLLLIPFLLRIKRGKPAPGAVLGHFVLWYGFLRIFIDFFRVYPTTLFGFPPGQEFNVFMTLLGLGLILLAPHRRTPAFKAAADKAMALSPLWGKRVLLVAVVLFPLVIPSDWTQDVPSRYAKRHPGINYSRLYPPVNN